MQSQAGRPPSLEGVPWKSTPGSIQRSQKPASLVNIITTRPFAATAVALSPSPVRRKPLPPNASPRFSSAELSSQAKLKPHPKGLAQRSYSIDSPAPLRGLLPVRVSQASILEEDFLPRDLDRYPHGSTPLVPRSPTETHNAPVTSKNLFVNNPQPPALAPAPAPQPQIKGLFNTFSARMASYSSNGRPPDVTFRYDGVAMDFIDNNDGMSAESTQATKRPKSPGQKFTSFFGWKSAPQQAGAESPTTPYSEHSLSPVPSPKGTKYTHGGAQPPKPMPPSALNIPKANAAEPTSYFNIPGTPLLSTSPGVNAHVEELERELREVSTELAESIRREMELEDEIERWKSEYPTLSSDANRRTSDYYSDSGASSIRYPISDTDARLDELEKMRRKAEQDRAQMRSEVAQKTQDELRKRRDLEAQVITLEEQLDKNTKDSLAPLDGDRIKELEASLEDARRRLAEERQVKENFEDLLTALRQDLEAHRNERDNLRDEVVPQLRARLEGLESEASEVQTLRYEGARMQQELQTMKTENQTLVAARRMQADLQHQQNRFNSIAEEEESYPPPVDSPRIGLSRSNSLARGSLANSRRESKRMSLSRSNSVKEKIEGQGLSDRLKDIEEQRDALHRALKNLLQRQEVQAREYTKVIRALEMERDEALNASPRRTAFHKEVAHLRDEVNHLRRRADDALDQKWQCEKGLGGLRMDLDRAQQETSSLRELLHEHDIVVPKFSVTVTDESTLNFPAAALDKAYQELRTTHALSLARIREMETEDSLEAVGEEAQRTMELLKQSISDAEAERDAAQQEAELYRQKARALQKSELAHLQKEQSLAAELYASAGRMDELAEKVQQQIKSNSDLRRRLADAIARGEEEQKRSADAIIELERRLKTAEDKVMAAQQASEETVSRHEEEVKQIQESHNAMLQRAKSGMLSPRKFPSMGPPSPIFANKSPRLDMTTSGPGVSLAEAMKTEFLEKRVSDLENALADADKEMEVVVSRMNMAQIEVAELQYERDEAMRETKQLQAAIIAEREKVKALMS